MKLYDFYLHDIFVKRVHYFGYAQVLLNLKGVDYEMKVIEVEI